MEICHSCMPLEKITYKTKSKGSAKSGNLSLVISYMMD